MESISQLILVLLLIIAGGFFTAAEYAIITVRKTRIEALAKRNHTLAKQVRQTLEKKQEYISTTQLGTTIVSLVLGWVGEPILANFLLWIFGLFNLRSTVFAVHFLAVILAFVILTFSSILFSELVPKSLALHKSERVAFATILPVVFIARIFNPFTRILNIAERSIMRRLGVRRNNHNEFSGSKEELIIFLNEVSKIGTISKEEKNIVNSVFQMNEKNILQLLKPRSEIEALDGNLTLGTLQQAVNKQYSRFPVYRKSLDSIIGFIHIKDLYHLPPEEASIRLFRSKYLRKIITVPATKKINEVFLDMRRKHVHMAVVYNEFGAVLGMVTLEDIIESVMGDIQDEFDEKISYMRRNSDGSYTIDGNAPFGLVSEKFHLTPTRPENTTIGGHVFSLLGHEPAISDKAIADNFIFTVTKVRKKQITKLRLARFIPTPGKTNNHNP